MKTKIATLILTLVASMTFGHGIAKIGPNGGRIVEFSKSGTMLAEITVKDGMFHIAVLDKSMKPVKMTNQSLTATSGDRNKPVKLEVTKTDKGFTLPIVKAGEWLIIQLKPTPDSKAVTARMEYNTSKCGSCGNEEWLCKCH